MKIRYVIRAALAFAASLLLMTAQAECERKTYEMPVRLEGGHVIASLSLNGTTVSLALSSASSFSMLTPSTAKLLKLPLQALPMSYRVSDDSGGDVETQLTRVQSVSFEGATWNNVEFFVGGNELGSGIQGLVGRNILSMGDTDYDLANGVVRLVLPRRGCAESDLLPWPAGTRVAQAALTSADKASPIVTARLNGVEVNAALDTGTAMTSVRRNTARRVGVKDAAMSHVTRLGGVGMGRPQRWTAPFASFELGGETFAAPLLAVDEGDGDGLFLGLDYFLSHRIYVSRWERKVYTVPNGGTTFMSGPDLASTRVNKYIAPPLRDANDPEAHARHAAIFRWQGNSNDALAALDKACELAPDVPLYRFQRARLRWAMNRWDDALADYNEALRLAPDMHSARLDRAQLLDARGQPAQARADLQRLDTELPPFAHARAQMARRFARLGAVEDSVRQAQLWLDSHPHDAYTATVLNERCWLRATRNIELQAAVDDCRKAVAQDAQQSNFQDSLGWALLRTNDLPGALKAFDAAIALKPDEAWPLYGRALVWQRQHKSDLAARDLREARRLVPDIDAKVAETGLPTAAGTSGS